MNIDKPLGWSTYEEAISSTEGILYFGGHFNNIIGKIPILHLHDFYVNIPASGVPNFPTGTGQRQNGFSTNAFAFTSRILHPVMSPELTGGSTFGTNAIVVTGGAIDDVLDRSASVAVGIPPFRTRKDKVVIIGDGVGALDALNWAWRQQDKVLALILRSPVVALEDYHARNAGGQAAAIEAAYGGLAAFTAALPDHDPMQNLDKLELLAHRIQCWVGSSDTTVLPAEVEAFSALIGAEYHELTGFGHTQAITGSPVDKQAVWAFGKVKERRRFYEGWHTGEWDRFEKKLFTNDHVTPFDPNQLVYGRIENPLRGIAHYIPQQANNYRELQVARGFLATDSEIFSEWGSGDIVTDAQQGHIHRYVEDFPFPGWFRTYMFWHDIAFGIPWIMNISVMGGNVNGEAGFTGTSPNGGGVIQGVMDAYGGDVLFSSAVGGVNTFILDANSTRLPVVGDTIFVDGTAFANGGYAITSVNWPTVTAISAPPAGDNPSGGTGRWGNLTRAFPYNVRSRVYGNPPDGIHLDVKAWAPHQNEPEWGDSYWGFSLTSATTTGPTTYGESGLFLGHIRDCIFGPVTVTEI